MWDARGRKLESIRGRRSSCVARRFDFFYCTTAVCFSPTLARRSWISRVSSSWRVSWIFVYSSVIRTVLWPAIFDASMLDVRPL
jgi:hypothetical protein